VWTTGEAFNEHLRDLIDKEKIVDYDDLTDKNGFEFIVRVSPWIRTVAFRSGWMSQTMPGGTSWVDPGIVATGPLELWMFMMVLCVKPKPKSTMGIPRW
jgi:hypothetical protein